MPEMVVLPERLSLSSSASLGSIRLMEKPVSSMSQTELVPLICARTTKCPRLISNVRRTASEEAVSVLASATQTFATNQSRTREYANHEIHEKRWKGFFSGSAGFQLAARSNRKDTKSAKMEFLVSLSLRSSCLCG